jgi:hypothetical protein
MSEFPGVRASGPGVPELEGALCCCLTTVNNNGLGLPNGRLVDARGAALLNHLREPPVDDGREDITKGHRNP